MVYNTMEMDELETKRNKDKWNIFKLDDNIDARMAQ